MNKEITAVEAASCITNLNNIVANGPVRTFTDDNRVAHPSHYNQGKIEVIEYIEDQHLDFCLGNAIKYISRAGKKQDYEGQDQKNKTIEDLNKAIWYLNRKIYEIKQNI